MKKTLAVLCALALCLCSLTVFVLADEAPAAPKNFQRIVDWANVDLTEKATNGDPWTVFAEAGQVVEGAEIRDGKLHAPVPDGTWGDVKTGTVHLNSVDDHPNLKGITTSFDTAGKNGISYNDRESGIAFYLEVGNNLETPSTFKFYIKTMNPDDSDKYDLVCADVPVDVPEEGFEGFKGWVTIPMENFTHIWDNKEGKPQGFFGTDCILWFYLNVSVYSTDDNPVDFVIGDIGLYGSAFQSSDMYLGLDADGNPILPEKPVTLVDLKKTTDLTEFDLKNTKDPAATAESKLGEDGLIHVILPEDDIYGWWWQPNTVEFYEALDDEGTQFRLRPGFRGETDRYDEASDKAGLAFYVDATELAGSSDPVEDPFVMTLMLCEWDYNEKGEPVLDALSGTPKGTWYSIPANVPAGYKGYVKVPFSQIVKNAWAGSDEGTEFDGKHIAGFLYWSSISHNDGVNAEMDFKLGDVMLWGEPIAEPAPEKPSEEQSNPDSGVSTSTGIASGLALSALLAAAFVCFRKK